MKRGQRFRGYGPVGALVVLFTVMAALVPTMGQQVRVEPKAAVGAPAAAAGAGVERDAPVSGPSPTPQATPGGPAAGGRISVPATTPGPATTNRSAVASPGRGAATPSASRQAAAPALSAPATAQGVRPCPSRSRQVPNDPYSPPCLVFSGDNGGATSRGVSAEAIRVSVRLRAYPGGTGPYGTWRWTPGRYTPTQDAREIYWDPSRRSVVNGQPGSYAETEPGRRRRAGGW